MIYQHFALGANESNAYIIGCPATREAALIDCGEYSQRIADFVEDNQLKLTHILLTHGHWDHTDGLKDFMQLYPQAMVVGVAQKLPADRLLEPQHEQTLDIGKLKIKFFNTTGHTSDSVSIYVEQEKMVYTGDALFAGSIGGTATDARKHEIQSNIHQNLMTLPEDTEVLPGHGPASTIGVEKKHNPLL